MTALRCTLILLILSGCFLRPDIPSKGTIVPPKKITPQIIDAYAISGNNLWKVMMFDLTYKNAQGDSVDVFGMAFRRAYGDKAQILLCTTAPNGREYYVQRFEYDNGLSVRAGGGQIPPLLTDGVDELISELLRVNTK